MTHSGTVLPGTVALYRVSTWTWVQDVLDDAGTATPCLNDAPHPLHWKSTTTLLAEMVHNERNSLYLIGRNLDVTERLQEF